MTIIKMDFDKYKVKPWYPFRWILLWFSILAMYLAISNQLGNRILQFGNQEEWQENEPQLNHK